VRSHSTNGGGQRQCRLRFKAVPGDDKARIAFIRKSTPEQGGLAVFDYGDGNFEIVRLQYDPPPPKPVSAALANCPHCQRWLVLVRLDNDSLTVTPWERPR
jgi:hypothetical protein